MVESEIVDEETLFSASDKKAREKLQLKIASVKSRIKVTRLYRNRILITSGFVLIISVFIVFFAWNLLGELLGISAQNIRIFGLGGIIYAILGCAFAFFSSELRVSGMQIELDDLEARLRIVYRFEEQVKVENTSQGDSYFSTLVRINIDNLSDYYTLVRVHTDNSFKVTISVGIVGFVLIVLGLVLGFFDDESIKTTSFIATGSGIIVEFISSVFFYLYNRTIKQLKGYHDSLLSVQNILLSFKLVGDMSDQDRKAEMMVKMIDSLITKKGGIITEITKGNKANSL